MTHYIPGQSVGNTHEFDTGVLFKLDLESETLAIIVQYFRKCNFGEPNFNLLVKPLQFLIDLGLNVFANLYSNCELFPRELLRL